MWIVIPIPKHLFQAQEQLTPGERRILWIGAIVAFFLCWLGCKLFRIPLLPHFNASLMAQPLVSLLVVFILFLVCVLIGSLTVGMIGFDAGLFCAAAGLCAVSTRGGGMRFVLFDDPRKQVWLTLMLEIVVLAIFMSAGTVLQHALHRARLLHSDEHHHVVNELYKSILHRFLALASNVTVIAIVMLFLAASDRKAQVLGAVAISSFLGTLLAYYIVPTKPSIWYWAAPLVVAIIGYGFQYTKVPGGWEIGEVRGTFAPLARALPLDYAGAGVAASILAYWISRRWQHEREVSTVTGDSDS